MLKLADGVVLPNKYFMLNIIKKFNDWYDRIQEPWRFLFFLFVFALPIIHVHAFDYPWWIRITVSVPVLTLVIYRIVRTIKKANGKTDSNN